MSAPPIIASAQWPPAKGKGRPEADRASPPSADVPVGAAHALVDSGASFTAGKNSSAHNVPLDTAGSAFAIVDAVTDGCHCDTALIGAGEFAFSASGVSAAFFIGVITAVIFVVAFQRF